MTTNKPKLYVNNTERKQFEYRTDVKGTAFFRTVYEVSIAHTRQKDWVDLGTYAAEEAVEIYQLGKAVANEMGVSNLRRRLNVATQHLRNEEFSHKAEAAIRINAEKAKAIRQLALAFNVDYVAPESIEVVVDKPKNHEDFKKYVADLESQNKILERRAVAAEKALEQIFEISNSINSKELDETDPNASKVITTEAV